MATKKPEPKPTAPSRPVLTDEEKAILGDSTARQMAELEASHRAAAHAMRNMKTDARTTCPTCGGHFAEATCPTDGTKLT